MISVFVVDDQDFARNGLRLRLGLEEDLTLVGEASDACSALSQIPALQPEVVLMDMVMPGVDGISATSQLAGTMPGVAIVMLSLYDDLEVRANAERAGAVAFVSKREPDEVLLAAIRSAR